MGYWQITGQGRAVRQIQGAIARQRIAHSYLLTGPRGSGKTTLARCFAQALNCEAEDPPCNECQTCRRVARGEDFAVREIDVAEGHQQIQIGQVREFERQASLTSTSGAFKIAIVPRAELFSEEAANAFLKTLEEPPPTTVIMLAAPAKESVPRTMASRCVAVALSPVPRKEIGELLSARASLEPEDMQLVLDYADGRPGWALELALDADKLENLEKEVRDIAQTIAGGPVARLAWSHEMGSDRDRALEAVETVGRYHATEGRRRAAVAGGRMSAIPRSAAFEGWSRNVRRIRSALDQLRANTMVRATIDNLALELEDLSGSAP